MRAWTGIEIQEEHDRLESEAATALGLMIFEYSRLDMELGLFLSWSDDGKLMERITKKVAGLNFSKRLEFLQKSVAKKFRDSPDVIERYARWLADAHAIRELRNQLFHGRWGVKATEQVVVNVIGLPTSPDQESTRYSIAELKSALGSVRELRSRLQKLRSSCPV